MAGRSKHDITRIREALAEGAEARSYEAEAAILLRHALGHIAYVLRPFPASLAKQPANLNGALAWMREQGLVHGPALRPNLTLSGLELARSLAAAELPAAAHGGQ